VSLASVALRRTVQIELTWSYCPPA
jgi:hypothetical protein